MSLVPVILAAGASTRMGCAKALLALDGRSFLGTMAATLTSAGMFEAAVVVGARADLLTPVAERNRLTVLLNAGWESGRMSSVVVAASHAAISGRGLLLWPVDCPGVAPETVAALVAEAGENPLANVIPSHAGRGGHPVALCAEMCRLLVSGSQQSLREALAGCGLERRFLTVADDAVLQNIDTRDDYETFLTGRRNGEAAHA